MKANLVSKITDVLSKAHPVSNGIKLIIGLGNPLPEYKNTYHNVGKLMADYLLEKFSAENAGVELVFRKKTSGNFESCSAGELTVAKPTNYMNQNGKAVKTALKTFGIKADSLLVAHDDSDIEIGKYKISFGSGSAGHNGVQSVIENLGTKNFWRLRIGIRPSPRKSALSPHLRRGFGGQERKSAPRLKAGELVLKKITAADGKLLRSVFKEAAQKII